MKSETTTHETYLQLTAYLYTTGWRVTGAHLWMHPYRNDIIVDVCYDKMTVYAPGTAPVKKKTYETLLSYLKLNFDTNKAALQKEV